MNNSETHDSVDTQYPLGTADKILTGILNPYFEQDKKGLLIHMEGLAFLTRLPVNIIFGSYEGKHFFEIIEHPSDPEICFSLRFSSELKFDDDGWLKEMPDCFYRAEKYLNARYPGHKENFKAFLEGLIVYGILFNEDTDDIGELCCMVSDLNESTMEIVNLYTAIRSTNSARALHKPYLTNGIMLQSTNKGTVIVNEHGDELCLLTYISCSAFIDKNVPMFKEQEIICVSVSLPRSNGSITEMEFRSFNTLPEELPIAPIVAIEYLRQEIPEQKHLLAHMVTGCIGSILNDIWDSEFHEKGLHSAEDMITSSVAYALDEVPSLT